MPLFMIMDNAAQELSTVCSDMQRRLHLGADAMTYVLRAILADYEERKAQAYMAWHVEQGQAEATEQTEDGESAEE